MPFPIITKILLIFLWNNILENFSRIWTRFVSGGLAKSNEVSLKWILTIYGKID